MKQKILYIITKSNFGGAQRYVYELATNLPKDHFDVVVACGGDGLLKEKLTHVGIKTVSIKNFERDINFIKEFRAMIEIFHVIRKEKPTIVHLNSSKAGGSGAFIAKVLGVPNIIFTAHGWPFLENRSYMWRAIAWFFSFLTTLLVHSVILVSRDDLHKTKMPGIQKKLRVIHTAVPDIAFKNRDEARALLFSKSMIEAHEHDTWVVSTSEHTQNKNLFAAIQAVEKFNASSVRKIFFTLMSDGELRSTFETYVKEHELQNYITFTGYVDNARTLLKAFDVFILPSYKEGLPFGLLEAGAAGLPVLASNIGGIPEVVENEKNGLLINPYVPESLLEGLYIYVNDTERMHSYGTALKQKIDSDFTEQKMFESTFVLYNS